MQVPPGAEKNLEGHDHLPRSLFPAEPLERSDDGPPPRPAEGEVAVGASELPSCLPQPLLTPLPLPLPPSPLRSSLRNASSFDSAVLTTTSHHGRDEEAGSHTQARTSVSFPSGPCSTGILSRRRRRLYFGAVTTHPYDATQPSASRLFDQDATTVSEPYSERWEPSSSVRSSPGKMRPGRRLFRRRSQQQQHQQHQVSSGASFEGWSSGSSPTALLPDGGTTSRTDGNWEGDPPLRRPRRRRSSGSLVHEILDEAVAMFAPLSSLERDEENEDDNDESRGSSTAGGSGSHGASSVGPSSSRPTVHRHHHHHPRHIEVLQENPLPILFHDRDASLSQALLNPDLARVVDGRVVRDYVYVGVGVGVDADVNAKHPQNMLIPLSVQSSVQEEVATNEESIPFLSSLRPNGGGTTSSEDFTRALPARQKGKVSASTLRSFLLAGDGTGSKTIRDIGSREDRGTTRSSSDLHPPRGSGAAGPVRGFLDRRERISGLDRGSTEESGSSDGGAFDECEACGDDNDQLLARLAPPPPPLRRSVGIPMLLLRRHASCGARLESSFVDDDHPDVKSRAASMIAHLPSRKCSLAPANPLYRARDGLQATTTPTIPHPVDASLASSRPQGRGRRRRRWTLLAWLPGRKGTLSSPSLLKG